MSPSASISISNSRSQARSQNPLPHTTQQPPHGVVVESSTDALTAAHNATDRMVDLLTSRWRFDPIHAYLLCSVAMHLHLSQVVNEPMITVSASLAKSILPQRTLFPTSL